MEVIQGMSEPLSSTIGPANKSKERCFQTYSRRIGSEPSTLILAVDGISEIY